MDDKYRHMVHYGILLNISSLIDIDSLYILRLSGLTAYPCLLGMNYWYEPQRRKY